MTRFAVALPFTSLAVRFGAGMSGVHARSTDRGAANSTSDLFRFFPAARRIAAAGLLTFVAGCAHDWNSYQPDGGSVVDVNGGDVVRQDVQSTDTQRDDVTAMDVVRPDTGPVDVVVVDSQPMDVAPTDSGPVDAGGRDVIGDATTADTATDGAPSDVACAAPMTMCGAMCVDLQRSMMNCGMCGVRCSGGERCMSGSCQ